MSTRLDTVDYNIEFLHIYGDEYKPRSLVQEKSDVLQNTRSLIDKLKTANNSYSLNILVDDYHRPFEVKLGQLCKELEDYGLTPHYILRESRLAELADQLLGKMTGKKPFVVDKARENVVLETASDNIMLWDDYRRRREVPLAEELRLKLSKSERPVAETMEVAEGKKYSAKVFLKFRAREGVRYSCPILTASWYLMRLGVEPFARLDLFEVGSEGVVVPFFGQKIVTLLPSNYLQVEATTRQIIQLSPWEDQLHRMAYLFF